VCCQFLKESQQRSSMLAVSGEEEEAMVLSCECESRSEGRWLGVGFLKARQVKENQRSRASIR
jgi:hypothetical protein